MTRPPIMLGIEKCICCEHPVSGKSPQALADGMRDHAEYVNTTKDRSADAHFEDGRLLALCAQ